MKEKIKLFFIKIKAILVGAWRKELLSMGEYQEIIKRIDKNEILSGKELSKIQASAMIELIKKAIREQKENK